MGGLAAPIVPGTFVALLFTHSFNRWFGALARCQVLCPALVINGEQATVPALGASMLGGETNTSHVDNQSQTVADAEEDGGEVKRSLEVDGVREVSAEG